MRRRKTHIIAASLFVAAVALGAAAGSQADVVVDSFGFPGFQGGSVNTFGSFGIAVNQTGAGGIPGGAVYVGEGSEAGEGTQSNRIQRLSAEGGFERLWGLDVEDPNEIQIVTITFGAKDDTLTVGGKFALTFQGDKEEFHLEKMGSTITPTAAGVQSGLEALPSIGAGNVRVRGGLSTTTSGGSYEIEFTGAKGGTNLPTLVIDDGEIEGSPPITTSVSTVQDGSGGPFAGFEICTIATQCKRGSTANPAPAPGGQVHQPAGIAVDQTTGDVYVSDAGDKRIEKFDANGNFLRAWGWDVVKGGGTGDVSSNAFEICTVDTDCKAGVELGSGGSVGFVRLAIDSAGNLWVADSTNRRFQEFEPDGTFVAAYGWHVNAGGEEKLEKCTSTAPGACQAGVAGSAPGQFKSGPLDITIDASGFIYAIDGGHIKSEQDLGINDRIQRFSPDMLTQPTPFAPNILSETGLSSLDQSHFLVLPGGGFVLSGQISGTGEDRLFELDASGEVVEESLAGDGLPGINGLAVGASGAVYALVANTKGGEPIGPGVVVIDDGPAQPKPGLTIEPPSGIGAEEATLNATVDPGGFLVNGCQFEYSTDQATWKVLPEPDCISLARDGGPQPVGETVAGLEPGTKYFVRFKAGRYYYAAGTKTSDEEEFETLSLPPIITDVGAAQGTDHSAWLAGEVKPRSQSFEYHFEYGTTPALGSSTPTVQGSGAKQRIVAQLVEGLSPNTEYFMKLVVTNAAGTTKGPEGSPARFKTRPQIPAPKHRAYEQVTPPEKNFTNPESGFPAANGEAAFVSATGGFGDPAGQIGEIATGYRSVRTKDGWRTRWHNETYCSKDLEETHFQPAIGGSPSGYSENLDFLAILRPEASVCPYPSLDPLAPTPQTNLYRADFPEAGKEDPIAYDLLAPKAGSSELSLKGTGGRYAGSSKDWSHVVYTSNGNQTEPPDSPAPGEFAKVYDWHEGEPHLVSKSPGGGGGTPFTTSSAVPEDALHGVSEEGDRIFFMNPGDSGTCSTPTCELYMRQNGTKTFDVSQSECTSSCDPDPNAFPDQFLTATADGAKALFKSAAKLLNEDTAPGSDLYLYTHTPVPTTESNLALLSKDEEPADGTSAGVLGLLGMSDDANIVYFAAQGQLIAGEPTGTGAKLYRWEANEGSPTLTYLATIASGSTDAANWSGGGPDKTRGIVQAVTPDGEDLLIHSAVRIDRGADHDEDADLYRWSQQDGWLCISCQVPTATSQGDVKLTVNGAPSHYLHAMSEDGGQVFFSTPDALGPGDINGNAERHPRDLYEWREDGSLELLSSGKDTRDVQFLGISTSGRDAFFITFKRLVGWDTDDSADVYDRCEGPSAECGFREPPPPLIVCNPNDGSCEGPSTSDPQAPRAATPAIEARPAHKHKKHKECARHTRKAKRRGQAAEKPHKKPRCRPAQKGSKR